MNYTSIEQSKKLLELGLSPESADMMYCYWKNTRTRESGIDNEPTVRVELPIEKCDIPCWSVGALLEVIPITCDVIKDFHNRYYCSNKFNDNPIDKWHITTSCKTPIDACFEMVVWLIENGYIKTK